MEAAVVGQEESSLLRLLLYGVIIAVIYLGVVSPFIEQFTHTRRRIPGPYFLEWLVRLTLSKIPSTGESLVHATSDDLVLEYFENYGGLFQVNFFGRKLIFVSDEQLAKHILASSDTYAKVSDESGVIRDMARQSLLLLEGSSWKRQRAALSTIFSHSKIEKFNQVIQHQANKFIDELLARTFVVTGGAGIVVPGVSIHGEMTKLAFEIIIRCGLGIDIPTVEEHAQRFHLILEEMQNPFRRYVPFWRLLPTRRNAELIRALASLKELILQAMESRPSASSLLGMMLEMENALTREEVIDNMMSFLLAGHETSASFLSFAFYLIASDASLQRDVRRELEASENAGKKTRSSETLDRVLKESLRLYPPAPMIGRVAERDDVLLDKYDIPKGSVVLISIYALHRAKSVWGADANVPNPARFASSSAASSSGLKAYTPFSSGSRTCIGNHFALSEGRIILASAIQRFEEIRLNAASRFEVRQLATLRPTPQLLLDFHVS